MSKKEEIQTLPAEIVDYYTAYEQAVDAVEGVPTEVLKSALVFERVRRQVTKPKMPGSRRNEKLEQSLTDTNNQWNSVARKHSILPHTDVRKAILHFAFVTEDARLHALAHQGQYIDLAAEEALLIDDVEINPALNPRRKLFGKPEYPKAA